VTAIAGHWSASSQSNVMGDLCPLRLRGTGSRVTCAVAVSCHDDITLRRAEDRPQSAWREFGPLNCETVVSHPRNFARKRHTAKGSMRVRCFDLHEHCRMQWQSQR